MKEIIKTETGKIKITAGKYQPLLNFSELTGKEQEIVKSDYDYLFEDEDCPNGFFRYRGNVLNLSEFMKGKGVPQSRIDWDGHYGTSAFSGYLVKLSDCGDSVQVAYFHC